ncbi:MAG TPA: Holliday junction resolvase RuvX [Vicinamibacterales bacterium]
MRALGIDYGGRRIGLAVSDPTGLLARPLSTVTRAPGEPDEAVARAVLQVVADLEREGEPIGAIVIGLPRRLDGTPNEQTPRVLAFADLLRTLTTIPVELQDERLTSREAESRLALREKDWRRRKAQLDAAAAAVMLQDFLDARRTPEGADSDAY